MSPVDEVQDGRTTNAKNFRLYEQTIADREIAVTSRKGPTLNTPPLGEILAAENDSIIGEDVTQVGVDTLTQIQPITFAQAGMFTRLDLEVRIGTATSVILVDIYSDDDGPARLLTSSSFSPGDNLEWETARFIKPVAVEEDDVLWAVLRVQDDGEGFAEVGTTTDGQKAIAGNSGALSTEEQLYALRHRAYVAPAGKLKGAYRFNRPGGTNITLAAYGTTMYKVEGGVMTAVATELSANATYYSFTDADSKVFWVNGYDSLRAWTGNTGDPVEVIEKPNMQIMSIITFHKDMLWGVSASDRSILLFSEHQGNPVFQPDGQTPTTKEEQWYYAWMPVSQIPVPNVGASSPITGIRSFQDNLVILTQDMKYILSGFDRGNFYLRESTGSKGALSARGIISDPNYIFFVADDGIYRFNGSKDDKVSVLIDPLFKKCPLKHEIDLALWGSHLRVYMASETSPVHDICAILDGDFNEWMLDTDTYVAAALYYNDANDNMELMEFSSVVPAMYNAEQALSSLGAPIDFDYRLKYDSRGVPGQRKKFRKYFPLVQAVGRSFPVTFGSDKDFEDQPKEKIQMLVVGGARIGEFNVDGTVPLTGSTAFRPRKTSISGYSRYMQFRISRKAVNNQVAFMGVQFTYKTKKL